MFEQAIDYHNDHAGTAIIIMNRGLIAANSGRIMEPFDLQSGSKPFVGALAVKIASELSTTIDGLMSEYIPPWRGGAFGKRACTVRRCLSMQSGQNGGYAGQAEAYEAAANNVIFHEDIYRFSYGPRHFQTYGLYAKNALAALGYKGDIAAYIAERVLPQGVHIDSWQYASVGEPLLASGARMTAVNWAAWGEYLRNVVATNAALASLIQPSAHYPAIGCPFWLTQGPWLPAIQGLDDGKNPMPEHGFAAWGYGNERLYVVGELVCARFGLADSTFSDQELITRLRSGAGNAL